MNKIFWALVLSISAVFTATSAFAQSCADIPKSVSLWCGVYQNNPQNYVTCPYNESIPNTEKYAGKPASTIKDSDGDCFPDCFDPCPNDPLKNYETGAGCCGCGVADIDTDNDGLVDCKDECPTDPNKTEPGQCGCGVSEAGVCGCGIKDVDTDKDGVMDCKDGCPSDPSKTAPGTCGCGIPDSGNGSCLDCAGVPFGLSVTDAKGACCKAAEKDECNICKGDGSSCKPQCTTVDVSATIKTVETNIDAQQAYLNKLLRTLQLSPCRNTPAAKKLIKEISTQNAKVDATVSVSSSKIPTVLSTCEPCDDVNNTASTTSYNVQSTKVLALSAAVINARTACLSGKCSNSGCSKRVKARQSLQKKDLKTARSLYNTTITSVKKVPPVTQQCEESVTSTLVK